MGEGQGKMLWDVLGRAESSSDFCGPEHPYRTHAVQVSPIMAENGENGDWHPGGCLYPIFLDRSEKRDRHRTTSGLRSRGYFGGVGCQSLFFAGVPFSNLPGVSSHK